MASVNVFKWEMFDKNMENSSMMAPVIVDPSDLIWFFLPENYLNLNFVHLHTKIKHFMW